jgi:hypothetical protein
MARFCLHVAGAVLCGLLALFMQLYRATPVIARTANGYGAKLGCSVVFVAKRNIQSAINAEFVFPPIQTGNRQFSVDPEKKCVSVWDMLLPESKQTACWRSHRLGKLMNS